MQLSELKGKVHRRMKCRRHLLALMPVDSQVKFRRRQNISGA